jgi:hypothetical protein
VKEFENKWLAEYGKNEADAAFRRARIQAFGRAVISAVKRGNGHGAADPSEEKWTPEGLSIPIDSIVGVMDANGGETQKLPRLRRAHLGEWRRIYFLESADDYPAIRVRRGSAGWYLTEEGPALVALEVLRISKNAAVRVSTAPRSSSALLLRAVDAESGCCGEHVTDAVGRSA